MHDHEFILAELRKLPWAASLAAETQNALAEQLRVIDVPSGSTVVGGASHVEDVHFVVQGRLTATIRDALGNQVLTRPLSRGMAVGIFALALGEDATLEVAATERSLLFCLPTQKLLQLTARFQDFQMAMFRLAAGNIRSMLLADRVYPNHKVVSILHQTEETRPFSQRLFQRLFELNESMQIVSDGSQWKPHLPVTFQVWVQDGELIPEEERQRQIQQWRSQGRLFLDWDADRNPGEMARLLAYSDTILWCVTPKNIDLAVRAIRKLIQIDPGWVQKIGLVWILDPATRFPPFLSELDGYELRDFKVSFHPPKAGQGKLLSQGLDRVVRYLRGVRIGLALGGGAARGMAHLGVLKALEDHGVYVDMIAGTSAGAMTGTVYAAGMSPEYATQCFKNDLQLSRFFKSLPGGGYWYLLYKYRWNLFDPMLRKYLDRATMQQLTIPVHTIAVDLVEGTPLIRSKGDAVRNILESINLPPLSIPIFDSGSAIVDGGLLKNVPADVLVSKGCNFVLASTVTAKLEKDFMGIRSKGKPQKKRFLESIQVMMRQNLIQSYSMNDIGVQPADIVIAPDVTSFDLSEFTRADEMAVIGEQTTLESMSRIRAMLAKLDPKLFPEN
ncbi:MAG: patatin-like phospholipase family protein [Planctomycetota bacterium]|jgi:NTE family protein